MEEKRRDPRMPVSAPCQLKWEGQVTVAQTENLSLGGVCLTHPDIALPAGTEISLTLYHYHLHGRVPYSIPPRIAPSGSVRFAVEFDGTGDHARFCSDFAERL